MDTADGTKNPAKAIVLAVALALFFVSALMVLLISVAVNAQMDRYEAMTTESTRNHLMSSAQALATLVSAEELDRYHTAEDTASPDYADLRERLIRFAQEHNVLFAYYWRDYGNGKLQYIVDNDTDPESQVGPDSIYDIEDVALDALSAKVGSTDLGTYTPTWDGLITGYAPVYDREGNFYCVAGIDISDEFIFIQRRDARNMTLLQIIALSVSVIFGALNILLYRRKNRQIQEAHLELQKASRAKSDFLAVMSHEIRTPLNAVIGLSQIELQGAGELPSATRDNIMQIHRSGSYLLGVINDILDISKIESEQFDLLPAEYHSSSLLGDVVNLSRVRIGSKPITFILEIGGDFPRTLVGDELRVKQILNNLLSNAAKYTQEGTITLSVDFTPCGENETEIRFTIRDTGIGIRPEDMEKLFDNYTRFDSGANRTTEGTGLGLSIAQNLSRMMGGWVTVESEYGAGSAFTVELMQGITGKETIGEETADSLRNLRYFSEGIEHTIRSPVPSARVLVVDDVPANLLVARGLLAPYGLDIDTATGGPEAIERVKTHNYGLIFLDHMMPEMDGIETALAIRNGEAIKTGTPIIALTANAMRGMKEYYLEHGFQDYLSKPINAKELDAILVKWLKPNSNRQPPNNDIDDSLLPDDYYMKVESLRLDMLNHYRASFEIGTEFDHVYFEHFTALVQSLDITDPPALQEQAALIEAGRKEDAHAIRETLPALCESLKGLP